MKINNYKWRVNTFIYNIQLITLLVTLGGYHWLTYKILLENDEW